MTGIGLRTVFALISQARFTDAEFSQNALKALLDVLQGHTPEELAQEPTEVIITIHLRHLQGLIQQEITHIVSKAENGEHHTNPLIQNIDLDAKEIDLQGKDI